MGSNCSCGDNSEYPLQVGNSGGRGLPGPLLFGGVRAIFEDIVGASEITNIILSYIRGTWYYSYMLTTIQVVIQAPTAVDGYYEANLRRQIDRYIINTYIYIYMAHYWCGGPTSSLRPVASWIQPTTGSMACSLGPLRALRVVVLSLAGSLQVQVESESSWSFRYPYVVSVVMICKKSAGINLNLDRGPRGSTYLATYALTLNGTDTLPAVRHPVRSLSFIPFAISNGG